MEETKNNQVQIKTEKAKLADATLTNPTLSNKKNIKPKKIGFIKIIENDLFMIGHYIKDEFFELTGEEAKHPKVKNAIQNGLIKKK